MRAALSAASSTATASAQGIAQCVGNRGTMRSNRKCGDVRYWHHHLHALLMRETDQVVNKT